MRELRRLLLVLAMPSAIACIFPYGAIGFVARRPPKPAAASCAFVVLTDEEEAAALAEARAAWQVDTANLKGMMINMSLESLPEESAESVMGVPDRIVRSAENDAVPWTRSSPVPSSLAAPAPPCLPRKEGDGRAESTFGRDDLLGLRQK